MYTSKYEDKRSNRMKNVDIIIIYREGEGERDFSSVESKCIRWQAIKGQPVGASEFSWHSNALFTLIRVQFNQW